MAVTPVRTASPSTSVVWPTRTPSTSVIAFSGPGGNTPGAMPMSRALGLAGWAMSSVITIAQNAAQIPRERSRLLFGLFTSETILYLLVDFSQLSWYGTRQAHRKRQTVL